VQQSQHVRASRGFSLIELMIGLVLGMIAVIVVMQVFSMAERSKRNTTSGDDALTNGAIALSQLQREARQSGQGSNSMALLGCNLLLPGGRTLNTLAPVTVNHASIPAGDSGTDTLLIVYANSNGGPEGNRINGQPDNFTFSVATPSAFRQLDYVVASSQTQPSPCNLVLDRLTAPPAGSRLTVGIGTTATYDTLFNWGNNPRVMAYAVREQRLTQCDFMLQDCRSAGASNWIEIIDGVVGLRAQYGRDTSAASPPPGIVDTYDQTTPTTICGWTRVSALRLALVTRSGEREKTNVTTTAPTWSGSANAPISLSGDSLWQQYRYKVFQSVVPMRNMAWQGAAC